MEERNVQVMEVSALWSVMLISIISMAITLGKELNADFKGLFTSLTGHHWTGHGIVIMLLFFVFLIVGYFILHRRSTKVYDIYRVTIYTIVVITVTSFVILIYYIANYVG